MRLYLVECLLLRAVSSTVMVRIRYCVCLVNAYEHAFILLSVVIVTLPVVTGQVEFELKRWSDTCRV